MEQLAPSEYTWSKRVGVHGVRRSIIGVGLLPTPVGLLAGAHAAGEEHARADCEEEQGLCGLAGTFCLYDTHNEADRSFGAVQSAYIACFGFWNVAPGGGSVRIASS